MSNPATIMNLIDQFLDPGIITDTIADRGYLDIQPNPWDIDAFLS
jgi:hypothetical protein